mmetsp:Transcript_11472/g.28543  ORF Transcript_11472/g.28543 Transcript_11472/m.28543 type:complete len:256 (+) Transcript_11472:3780-4547(+)
MIATDQSPQLVLGGKRHMEGTPDAHILVILGAARMNAPQARRVERHPPRGQPRRGGADERGEGLPVVSEQPRPVLHQQAPRPLRDVGGGEVVRLVREERVVLQRLRNHLPMLVIVDLVDHHAVEPRHPPDLVDHHVKHLLLGRLAHRRHRLVHLPRVGRHHPLARRLRQHVHRRPRHPRARRHVVYHQGEAPGAPQGGVRGGGEDVAPGGVGRLFGDGGAHRGRLLEDLAEVGREELLRLDPEELHRVVGAGEDL